VVIIMNSYFLLYLMKKRTKNMKFYYKRQMIFGMNLQQEQRVGKGKKYNNNNKNYHKWFVKEKFKIVINHNSLIQGFRPV